MGGNVGDCKVVDGKVIFDVVASKTGDIGDGKYVASKDGDIGDNGGMTGMTCGVVGEGGVEVSGANRVDVDSGNIVSCVDRPPPLPQPQIGCILTILDDVGSLMNGSYDVDASSLCTEM